MTPPGLEGIFSESSERAVIGSVLLNPETFELLTDTLVSADFFLLRHRNIWDACAALNARHIKIDFITLQDGLKAAAKLDDVGGPGYLLGLINDTPSSINAEAYAKLVKRASVRRQLQAAADKIKTLAGDELLTTEEAVEQAAGQLQAVASVTASEFHGMVELVGRDMDQIERAMETPGQLAGIPSVIPKLGALLGGYEAGRLYIVAARPGMGKTSFLCSEALFMAQRGVRVAIASQEMSEEDMTGALVSVLAGVPRKLMKEGRMTPDQYSAYVKAAGKLATLPIFIDDQKMTPKQMSAKVRKLQYRKGVDVLMVDYIQLMKTPGGVRQEEYDRVTAISIELAELTKTLNVPILAAAQLNRGVEDRSDKHPQLSDLRSSGQLEQDAAVVMFPFRPAVYEDAPDVPPAYEEAEIGIAKNRFGPCGMIRCAFRPVLKQWLPTETKTTAELLDAVPNREPRAERTA